MWDVLLRACPKNYKFTVWWVYIDQRRGSAPLVCNQEELDCSKLQDWGDKKGYALSFSSPPSFCHLDLQSKGIEAGVYNPLIIISGHRPWHPITADGTSAVTRVRNIRQWLFIAKVMFNDRHCQNYSWRPLTFRVKARTVWSAAALFFCL